MTTFGQKPYKSQYYYGLPLSQNSVPSDSHAGDEAVIRTILEELKQGEFGARSRLVSFLTSSDFDIRQYACQLFAHTCSHDQIHIFREVIELPSLTEPREARRLAVRLGETNSLLAIPLLFEIIDQFECDCEDVNVSVFNSISNLVHLNDDEQEKLLEPRNRVAFLEQVESMDESLCYFHAKPIDLRMAAEKFYNSANKSLKENRPAAIYNYELLFNNFSGIASPIASSSIVKQEDLGKLKQYISQVLGMNLTVGQKYFYGRPV